MKEKKKAVFLDRDGTLIEEVNFLSTPGQTRLFPFTAEALRLFADNGYILVVVTNQSGIARGIFGESAVNAIHEKIRNTLAAEGVEIASFHFCPHLPDAGCACRKPNTGMIEEAGKPLEIDLAQSWMIGDKLLDIELGFNAGTRTALVRTGYGRKHEAVMTRRPDIVAENLLDAARRIAKSGGIPEIPR